MPIKNKIIKVALVGQPNVGKSMLINSISNARLKVGNFSGVTVTKEEVVVKYKNYKIIITDLPGSYSLNEYTLEEKVTKEFLENENFDLILNVVDSTNLERNLYLTTELLALEKKLVLALNMTDEAIKEKINVDDEKLSTLLSSPCVKTSASKKIGIKVLLESIVTTFENEKRKNTFNFKTLIDDDKFEYCKNIVEQVVKEDKSLKKTITEQIDLILMNKYLGLPIFLFLMWGLFQLTFELGNIPMEMIDSFFASLIDETKNALGHTQLASIIGDGAIAGVGSVVLFLPNIVILFLGIALLETTGYMSRVAYLLDGFFYKFGLHGKSFIPLVTGFGCSVPAYMSARTLKNERDRLLTLFIIGFMSCSARLPIYVLFAGAFFSAQNAGNILFIIYISGAILGLFAAKILKITVFKSSEEPFVMEMPKYRMPSLKLIYHTVINQAMMYLKKAGTFILAASVLIWFASNYPKYPLIDQQYETKIEQAISQEEKLALLNEHALYNLENSYLGMVGKASQPLFAPLGFDWKMSVALETGLAAKEIVVSTLGILYGLGEAQDESSNSLIQKVKENIPFASAIAFIVFVMIYLPCIAASMVFAKEAGSWKYLGYLFVFTTSTAWLLSFIVYNIVKVVV